MAELQRKFGTKLKQLREASHITQDELADRIGRSSSFISSLERGVDAPSFDTLEKLASALEIDVFELFNFQNRRFSQ